MANSTVCQSKWKPIVEPRRAKPKTYLQAPTHWLKFYEEAVIESEVFNFSIRKAMLNVLIIIASIMRTYLVHTTYSFMIKEEKKNPKFLLSEEFRKD